MKPRNAAGGTGVSIGRYSAGRVLLQRNTRVEAFPFETIYDAWAQEDVILEEHIVQHQDVNRIYGLSVNSIRIHTLNINQNVEIIKSPSIRFGAGGGNVDFDNGIMVGIHKETGRLYDWGIPVGSLSFRKLTSHPDSGIAFGKTAIPYWNQVMAAAVQAAKQVPEISYIGWDIAVTPRGPAIIEGNGASMEYRCEQFYTLEKNGVGTKRRMNTLLEAFDFCKEPQPDRIEQINRQLFIYENPGQTSAGAGQCDIVVVLGSTRCEARIRKAYELFGGSAAAYIVSGGGESAYSDSSGTILTESEFMYHYLIERGVAPESIVMENCSRNTLENITYVLDILEKSARGSRIAIVTASFHLPRVMQIIQSCKGYGRYNILPVPVQGELTRPDNWFKTCYGASIIFNELDSLG